jgi:AraC-like DNA-binding protein
MPNLIFSIFPNENFIDLSLYQYGWEKCTPSHSYGPAKRNHYLFHYVISGTGTVLADDKQGNTKTHHIKSMQGFMIFPDQITTYIADKDIPWEYVWIEFDGLKVKEALDAAGLSMNNPVYRAQSKTLRENMFNEMMYIKDNRDSSPFHLIGHLYLFFDYLTRSSERMSLNRAGKTNELRSFYIKEALAFIEHNFQNDITVEDIADTCGLNRSYFGKIFKETLGKSPQEFLLNYRMIKATELLKLTRLSIGDIGLAIGYENQLHFSRAFKKIYNVSPREWRNKNRVL